MDSSSQTVTSAFATPVVNGSIYFTTSPSYAEIYLDSVYTGTTPLTLYDVTPGSYSVKYYRSGYTNWSDSFTVTAGVEQDVYAALTAIETTTETTAVTTSTTSPTVVPVAAVNTAAITTHATTKVKSAATVPTPWPTSTTQASPVDPVMILGGVGMGLFAIRKL